VIVPLNKNSLTWIEPVGRSRKYWQLVYGLAGLLLYQHAGLLCLHQHPGLLLQQYTARLLGLYQHPGLLLHKDAGLGHGRRHQLDAGQVAAAVAGSVDPLTVHHVDGVSAQGGDWAYSGCQPSSSSYSFTDLDN
jgi:hypothetical protein